MMMLIDIFIYYVIASSFLNDEFEQEGIMIYINLFYASLHSLLKMCIAHFGARTTIEAEEIKTILSRKTNESKDPSIFHEMMLQAQTRDLKVQNIFFVIDWKFILTVRINKLINCIKLLIFLIADHVNNCDIFSHHLSVSIARSLSDFNQLICLIKIINFMLFISHLCFDIKTSKMDNFYTSIKPFCIFANYMGFFPFSFDGPARKGFLKIKKINVLQIVLVLIILTTATVGNFVLYVYTYDPTLSFFRYSVWTWLMVFADPIIFLQFFIQLKKQHEIRSFLKLMHDIDLRFMSLGLQVDHKSHRKFVRNLSISIMFLPCMNYIIPVLGSYYYGQISSNTFAQEFFYFVYVSVECFIFTQFVVFTYLLRERFKLLSKLLR
jgi:hypothetical protein